MKRASLLALALALASASGIAHATEGGGLSVYPDGLENFMSGALPPPGVYGIACAGSLRTTRYATAPAIGWNLRISEGGRDGRIWVGLAKPRNRIIDRLAATPFLAR